MAENNVTKQGPEVKVLGGGKGNAVDLRKRVTVYATDKSEFHTPGQEMNVSPVLAEDFIKRGVATETKPAEKKK